ncbi:TetR/AcrR family transcriptional regulator [Corynebacterium alimapuense]|uniref:Transcriptional regulator n=1 Tax=Corynebacterium alimapuense TaxID=1576874 RepID=A0A3M8K4H3_9CORY|nr:TetR/AcrR family transcriptional regulator [Corynebacterium alimapuense]RNE48086.1 transcriptional regulator [Corynebacterium alimapuense]
MPLIKENPLGPGRPRVQGHDERIIAAALLLIDSNQRVSISALVKESGVSRAAIYRRWPSLADLIAAALDQGRNYPKVDTTGDIKETLFTMMFTHGEESRGKTYSLRRFRKRLELSLADPDLQRAYWNSHVKKRRDNLLAALETAKRRDEIRADVNIEAALDMLLGVFYYQLVVRGSSMDDSETKQRCIDGFELVWKGMK